MRETIGKPGKQKMHDADHQAALASSVVVGMLSFAHRPVVYQSDGRSAQLHVQILN